MMHCRNETGQPLAVMAIYSLLLWDVHVESLPRGYYTTAGYMGAIPSGDTQNSLSLGYSIDLFVD